MAYLLPQGKQAFEDAAGAPLVGGRLWTYAAGTSTPKLTYSDAAGTTPNTNPIILDARGEAVIFWSGAYKVRLETALSVLIWTVDNVNSDPTAAELDATLRADLANKVDAAKGAGLVGFSHALNYAVGTLGDHAAFGDDVDVTQFPWLVKNDGSADAGAGINAAIIASQGRWRVFLTAGTYLLTTPIQANEQTGTAILRKATHLVGAGIEKTKLLNRTGDYAVKHTVTLAQSNAQSKAYNGYIGGFTIYTDGSSPVNSAGITLESFWMGRVEDIQIEAPKGRGINVDVNAGLNPNSDYYSCGNLHLKRIAVSAATGIGIYHGNPGTTVFSEGHYIVNCVLGGIYVCGANGELINGALAGNSAFGIKVAFTTTTPHDFLIRGNEIDNNAGKQVIIEGYHNCVTQNRFIQTEVAGAFPATHSVYIDATVSGGATANEVSSNLMDLRDRVSGTHTWTQVVSAAGATANLISETVFTATAGLTKYDLPALRARNYAVEDGLVVANSAQTPTDDNCIAIIVVSGGQTLSTTAATKLTLGGVISNESGAFDAVTNYRFTAPYPGVMRVHGGLKFQPINADDVEFTLHLYKNGSAYHSVIFARGLATVGTDEVVPLDVSLKTAAGDYYELFAQCGTANRIVSSSSTTSTMTFEML